MTAKQDGDAAAIQSHVMRRSPEDTGPGRVRSETGDGLEPLIWVQPPLGIPLGLPGRIQLPEWYRVKP